MNITKSNSYKSSSSSSEKHQSKSQNQISNSKQKQESIFNISKLSNIAMKVYENKQTQEKIQKTVNSYMEFYEKINEKSNLLLSNEYENRFKIIKKEIMSFIKGKEDLSSFLDEQKKVLTNMIVESIDITNQLNSLFSKSAQLISSVDQIVSKAETYKNETNSIKKLADVVNQLDCVFEKIKSFHSLQETMNNLIEIQNVKDSILQDKEFILMSNKEKCEKKERELRRIEDEIYKIKENIIRELKMKIENEQMTCNERKSRLENMKKIILVKEDENEKLKQDKYIVSLKEDYNLRSEYAKYKSGYRVNDEISFRIADEESELNEILYEYNKNILSEEKITKDFNQSLENKNPNQEVKYEKMNSKQSDNFSLANYSFQHKLNTKISKLSKMSVNSNFSLTQKIIENTNNNNTLNKDVKDLNIKTIAGLFFYSYFILIKTIKFYMKNEKEKELIDVKKKVVLLNEKICFLENKQKQVVSEKEDLLKEVCFYKKMRQILN